MKIAYTSLRQELKKRFPSENSELLDSESLVFLTLDRALSPAGDRRLKDARVLMSRWPNPGVYRIPQLTEKILLQIERKSGQSLLKDPFSTVEILDLFRSLNPARRLRHLYARNKQFKQLHPTAIRLDRWSSVLGEYESSNSLELKEWSEIIIDFLKLRIASDQKGRWLSPWQSVETVLSVWPEVEKLSARDWLQIFERDPNLNEPLKILLIESREAYALERAFLEAMQALGAPQVLVLPITGETPIDFQSLKRAAALGDDAAIFWASPERTPTSSEVLEWIPGNVALDVASDDFNVPDLLFKELYNYCNYRRSGSPNKHPWLFMNHSPLLKLSDEPGPATLWDRFRELFKNDPSHFAETLTAPKTFQDLEDWFFIFLDLGLTLSEEETKSDVHERIRNDGIPILGVHDLLYSPDPKKVLWGTPQSLEELCDPYSASSQARSLLPPQLEECFEAEGILIPKISREMEKLRGVLRIVENEISLLKIEREKHSLEVHGEIILGPYAKEKPSPTAMESYIKCGLRFYFERVLRLEDAQIPDPERIQDNLKGQWVHRVLELILPNLATRMDSQHIQQLFDESLDEIFTSRISQAYRQLLVSQAKSYGDRLERHIADFELPLLRAFPNRKVHTEHWVEGIFQDQLFCGKVDRIDDLGNGQLFLWDYKTNDRRQKMATLIKNNSFQWYHYKKMIESSDEFRGKSVVGGGYVNPLNPEKSRVIVLSHGLLNGFVSTHEDLNYNFEIFEEKHDQECTALLNEKISIALNGLKKGVYNPLPHKETECLGCRYTGICGRPYLVEENPS